MALGDLLGNHNTAGSGGTRTFTPTLTTAATEGNLLVVVLATAAASITLTVEPTDFARLGDNVTTGELTYGFWWKEAVGGEEAETVTWTGTSAGGYCSIAEYDSTGLDLSVLDDSGEDITDESTSVTSVDSGSATNSQNTAFAIAYFACDLATGMRDSRSYTNSFAEDINQSGTNNSRAGGYLASKVLSSTGANTTTLSSSDSGAFATGAIAVWSAAGGGGGGPPLPIRRNIDGGMNQILGGMQ